MGVILSLLILGVQHSLYAMATIDCIDIIELIAFLKPSCVCAVPHSIDRSAGIVARIQVWRIKVSRMFLSCQALLLNHRKQRAHTQSSDRIHQELMKADRRTKERLVCTFVTYPLH